MNNLSKFSIVTSFFSLWITSYFTFDFQTFLGFVIILLFGILHGANDIALFKKVYNLDKKLNTKIFIYYVFVVLLGLVCFYFIPTLTLLIFIIISSYHFGEQHWKIKLLEDKNKWFILFYTLYGMFILFLLFAFHNEEVRKIIFQICQQTISSSTLYFITIITGVLLFISGIKIFVLSKSFKKEIVVNLFYLIVFAIIFKTADLIWAFAIYFIIWHSFPSIIEQIKFLYGDFTFKNGLQYFKSALLYWLISLIGIFILQFLLKEKEYFNALFFSFLASITFPHVVVIIKMFNKSYSKLSK